MQKVGPPSAFGCKLCGAVMYLRLTSFSLCRRSALMAARVIVSGTTSSSITRIAYRNMVWNTALAMRKNYQIRAPVFRKERLCLPTLESYVDHRRMQSMITWDALPRCGSLLQPFERPTKPAEVPSLFHPARCTRMEDASADIEEVAWDASQKPNSLWKHLSSAVDSPGASFLPPAAVPCLDLKTSYKLEHNMFF